MCGIFGAIHLGGYHHPASKDQFQKLTDLVRYRGPDDSGHILLDVKAQRDGTQEAFDVFLGHRRLSIIDLSPEGRNPITDGAGRWLIFNGEIFNYLELRETLRKEGYAFRTQTDTEVILAVYQRYGEQGFELLNGMWAFALVDLPGQRVVLSRDRFSIKPLYMATVGPAVYFASEAKQLLPLLPRREINPRVMYSYLTQALLNHTSETFFEGLNTVPAKHNVVIDLRHGTVRQAQYWEYQDTPLAGGNPVEQFHELFLDSVRIRLRSDVKLGALVSGGLDSSAIAVVANDILGGSLQTYSVVGDDKRFSEKPFVDDLVRMTGLHNRQITFRSGDALTYLRDAMWHNDEPFLGLHAVAQYQMLEAIRNEGDVTVLLSGQGGDECMLGYKKFFFFHLQELLSRGKLTAVVGHLLSSLINRTVAWQFSFTEAKRYLPRIRPKEPLPFVTLHGTVEALGRSPTMAQRQRLDIDRFSVPPQTHFEDRNSMAHSLELRPPFLDHRLVEFLVNLSVDLKLRNGWTKYVLRAALPQLPPAIRWRRDKQGFTTPEEKWMREDLRGTIREMFRDSILHRLGVIDQRAFLRYYDRYLRRDPSIWYAEISRVYLAETWARIFVAD